MLPFVLFAEAVNVGEKQSCKDEDLGVQVSHVGS